ncbi:endochitinase [Angomonas deanei]|nr:endochitinase [Angomonas deanei]|eukprot:EPY39370.1 endochitinase [Angomonas deanei]
MPPLSARHVFLLLVVLFLFVRAAYGAEEGSIVCTCRCCYQGGCSALPNVKWVVSSCSECSTKMCNEYITSSEVRAETARLFEGIQGDEPLSNGNIVVQECQVISVLEAATCAGWWCKRTTTIKAECYNRDAPLIKYTIVSFVLTTIAVIVFGMIKNYIPALQTINERYFNSSVCVCVCVCAYFVTLRLSFLVFFTVYRFFSFF